MIAIGGNTRNTGSKQGFEGPGEGMDIGITVLIPGETLGTGIDDISLPLGKPRPMIRDPSQSTGIDSSPLSMVQ